MNLYLIERTNVGGYDTYDSAVVAAESETIARNMHPTTNYRVTWNGRDWIDEDGDVYNDYSWVTPNKVTVEFLGTYTGTEARVICSSFNAG